MANSTLTPWYVLPWRCWPRLGPIPALAALTALTALAVLTSCGAVSSQEDDDAGTDVTPDARVASCDDCAFVFGQKMANPEAAASDVFGRSVAVHGDIAVVGTHADDGNDLADSGSLYVYERNSGAWFQTATLRASDAAAGDQLGYPVAVHGTTIAASARLDGNNGPGSGAVYVFEKTGGVWTQIAKLTSSDTSAGDQFGEGLTLRGDVLAVGAHLADSPAADAGAVYVFERQDGAWNQTARLVASDAAASDRLGVELALSSGTLVAGAYLADVGGVVDAGAAYVFEKQDGAWTEVSKLTASGGVAQGDQFGRSVAADGGIIVVSSYLSDVAAVDAGAIYIFENSAGVWRQVDQLQAPDAVADDRLGHCVDVSNDTVVAGAYLRELVPEPDLPPLANVGAVYVFEQAGGAWIYTDTLLPSDPLGDERFGVWVDVQGRDLMVGGSAADDADIVNAGAAYAFEKRPL